MKYEFEEQKIYGGYVLHMHLEDVSTLKGSIIGLEELFQGDLGGALYFIKRLNEVLSGKKAKIESGTNLFWYTITSSESSFECMLEDRDWNFTISTRELLEIAVTWENRVKEFCKKYKYR